MIIPKAVENGGSKGVSEKQQPWHNSTRFNLTLCVVLMFMPSNQIITLLETHHNNSKI